MKKILCLMKYPLQKDYNLKHKFDGQIKALDALGLDVYYLAYDAKAFYCINKNHKEKIKSICFSKSNIYMHSLAFIDMYISAIKLLNKNFDYIYYRSEPIELFGYIFFKLAHKNTKLICEIPTYPIKNNPNKGIFFNAMLRLSDTIANKVGKYIDFYTVIGENCNGTYNNKPSINIENAMDSSIVNIRKPKVNPNEINMLALASMSDWQGFDRVIKSLKTNRSNYKLVLHMVGNDGDGSLKSWEELVFKLNLKNNVIFHGTKYANELDSIVNTCDIAFAPLGLYRIGFNTCSALKVREYSLRGLPFVYAFEDHVLEVLKDYTLKIPNNDSLIDIDELISFALSFRDKSSVPENIRNLAVEHMSWEKQFKKILNFADNLK